jgi:cardiolipin synthase A/B
MFPSPSSPATVALSAFHVALALAVTAHALAHKRDPGSAVAWIGLAWLSPVIGSVLYALLGINRVQRRARGLRGPPPPAPALLPPAVAPRSGGLAALEIAALRISGRAATDGNSIAVLHNGDDAYPQMLAAIDGATASIALSTYIFRADALGLEFIAALARARRRGVAIRVLIDGYGGGYVRSAAYRELSRAGIRVDRFLHSALPWRMPFLNLRSHRKLLAVDGAVAFAGGLNIGAENLTASHARYPVRDTHFRFAGPVVAQFYGAFAEQWSFTTGEVLSGEVWVPAPGPAGKSTARVVTSGPDQDLEKIELLVLAAINAARRSIRIMTPYFLPDDRVITALALAAMRGVEVDIVVPEHSNHPTVDWAMRAHVDPLLQSGCRIWLHAPPFNHSKLLAVDETWSFVGSANFDTRSFTLNFEINVEVYCSDTALKVNQTILDSRNAPLLRGALNRRPVLVRMRDSAARLWLPYL